MFNWRGDPNGRHHAPDRPLLDAVTGLGFLAGLGLLIRRWRRPECRFLLGALFLTTLPGVLAVDGPHAGRTIGAAAFACLVAGIGWIQVQRCSTLPRALLIVPVMVAGALNAWTYFVTMPVDPRVWGAFYPVETQMGVFVRNLAEERGAPGSPTCSCPGRWRGPRCSATSPTGSRSRRSRRASPGPTAAAPSSCCLVIRAGLLLVSGLSSRWARDRPSWVRLPWPCRAFVHGAQVAIPLKGARPSGERLGSMRARLPRKETSSRPSGTWISSA